MGTTYLSRLMTHSMVSTFDLERDSSSFRLLPLLSLTIAISTFLEGRFGTVVAFSFIISVSPKYTYYYKDFETPVNMVL